MEYGIKTNILIGLGDLLRQHQNIIEPKLYKIYRAMTDKNVQVRKTCLLVIFYLIMSDKLKIKHDISNIAILIEDSDQSVQNYVRQFFVQIHKKDPKQYFNLIPDLVEQLSQESVDEQIFASFAKSYYTLIDKDKSVDLLVEKFVERFEQIQKHRNLIAQQQKEGQEISKKL